MGYEFAAAASGDAAGVKFSGDTWTNPDTSVIQFMPQMTIAIGDENGPYSVISATNPLPVTATALDVRALTNADVVTIEDGGGSITVDGTFWQATQPISAASLPLPSGASTEAKQPALGTAGTAATDVISIQGIATMTPVLIDGSATTQPVSGTFFQATQPVSGTFWQTTQPISGTITETNSADSLTSLQLIDDAAATIGTTDVLRVAVFDASNNQITSFGGGGGGDATAANQTTIIGHVDGIETLLGTIDADTSQIRTLLGGTLTVTQNVQYTEADVDTTITGTAIMWEDTSNVLRAVSASKPLPIGGELTNLAQLGGVAVSMGAGARDAGTQRITVATDDILLSSYGADLTTIAGAVAGTEMQVDVLTMPSVVLTATATDGTTKFVGGVTKVIGIGAVVTPTPTVPVTDDIGMPGMSVDRRLWVDADITASVALDVSAATVTVDGSGVTQPVTATALDIRALTNADVVTAELSAVDNAVLDVIAAKDFATQTTLASVLTDTNAMVVDLAALEVLETTIASPVATIGATPLQRVAIFDAADSQITSFGGGTQYTEADTSASLVGNMMMWEDSGDSVVTVSASTPMPVTLDTMAFTLAELPDTMAGDLAAQAASLSSLDGKVTACDTGAVVIASGTITTVSTVTNLAQMGGVAISLNTGVRDTGTQRVTIATDDVVPVTGTFFQATQPVSVASLPLPADAATQTTLAAMNAKFVTGTDIGDVTINNASGASAVNIQDGGNSITVDGTITANLSATDNAVLDSAVALLTTIDADTSTLAAIDFATGADVSSLGVVGGGTEAAALRVTIANDSTGVLSIDDNGGSITVDGTFFQATQPVSIAATVTVDGSGVTQPVSGTVTANPASGTIDTVTTVGAVTSITNAVTVEHSTGSLGDGSKAVTTAGVPEALAGSTAIKWVMVTAYETNTGRIAVGGASVDAGAAGTGTPLKKGQTATLIIDNLADVYIDASVSTEGVRYSYGAA